MTETETAAVIKHGRKNFEDKRRIEFPLPSDININMMPYIIGDSSSIPEIYHHYLPIIRKCEEASPGMYGSRRVGYLTIHESFVPAGSTQRRPGLHTDRHQSSHGLETKGGGRGTECIWMQGWGGSRMGSGMYIASNVADSCMIWDCRVEIPGELGDCEHLRDMMGEGQMLKENNLYWLSDATPHEALPMKVDGYRQFFRWVGDEVAVWYEQHSTRNPLGIEPRGRIVTENKFEAYVLK